MRRAAAALVAIGVSGAILAARPPQPPKFSAAVEVTRVDVGVVDDRGRPIQGLTAADFSVRVDGAVRRVVSAEWVPLAAESKGVAPIAVPEGYSSNENATGGRLIVIAVDQPNIRFGANISIARAAAGFIDRLSPADRIAVVGFGMGAPSTPFTADRARAKQALARMTGQKESHRSAEMHNISTSEAQSIDHGDRNTLQSVEDRECGTARSAATDMCRAEVESEAFQKARDQNRESNLTLSGLQNLLTGLKSVDAPKTLILISEGFVLDDPAYVLDVGRLAADARTSVYALRLDRDAFDASEARPGVDALGDRQNLITGLGTLAGAARGAVFEVAASSAQVFERIESELSGYYLLGLESDPRDRDGRAHPIRIDVGRRGAIVRTRRQFMNTAVEARDRTPKEAVIAGLASPLVLSALPVRVSTYALQQPDGRRVQLLIHADIGTDYSSSRPVSLAFLLFDGAGTLVDSQSADGRLAPMVNGVPSPLQFTGGSSVAPGEYTLKLAVAEGGKVGSVEHQVHAVVASAGAISISDFAVGGPLDATPPSRPTVGYTISYGLVHGYLEAYGKDLSGMSAVFEVAAAADGPALLNAPVAPRPAGDARAIFSHVMPVQQLPAGKYVLRATLRHGADVLKTLVRPFEVAPPAVLLTSAEGAASDTSTDAELFLPVADDAFARPFQREDAIAARTLEAFKARVAPSLRTPFDAGVAFITAGDYVRAEASFKKAIQPDSDSTSALTYLAVAFAASGHDREAASAFQTALVDGSDLPEIYDWLGGSLLRTHDLAEARTIFEEAAGKWPADVRFTRPLAMLYATFGRGREAVRTLERYLDAKKGDSDALFLAVEWIYQVHAAGGAVHSRAQDVKLAHAYADAYEQAGGAQTALVKQWTDFLDGQK
ncbi:MAG TPA: VWA domain-containing protein [Vicinamibacterales bacterium]|nr:VWA domain-containing protein [Vicinamibacterales bacterium]